MSALAAAKTSKATIKWLAAPTSDAWLELAIAHPLELLIDHAHCERKAAGAIVQLMFRYLCEPGLAEVLSPLARE
ncbi:MAG: tRNA isopentenyl-2-thiomethyl-A-37 hydroxylase MiaE, partial [Cyanobacteriota bacterium]|nr:tRNA isopentenyl-2-thiomethyl-A-37 hydroxylase MiaE [Cyanobacteriota bacterium]